MITTGGNTIKLTAEQNLQLIEWQQRLSVIQTEIEIAEKHLASVKDEIETRTKHLNYLEEQKKISETNLLDLSTTNAQLKDEVQASLSKLGEHTVETQERNRSLHEKEQYLAAKESDINQRHTELSDKVKSHSEKEQTLQEREILVEKALQAFSEATKSVTWK